MADMETKRLKDSIERMTGERGANRAIRQSDMKAASGVALRISSQSFSGMTDSQKIEAMRQDIETIVSAFSRIASSTGVPK